MDQWVSNFMFDCSSKLMISRSLGAFDDPDMVDQTLRQFKAVARSALFIIQIRRLNVLMCQMVEFLGSRFLPKLVETVSYGLKLVLFGRQLVE